MLKVDLHMHTKGDPVDTDLEYTPKDMIQRAAKLNFNAIAITWHNKVCETKPLEAYAKKKGIMLLQGVELTIDGKHTLLYNVTQKEVDKIKTMEDLEKIKDHALIGAPHPYYLLPNCLGRKLKQHKEVFDFVEHSHFYTKGFNLNKRAVIAARELKLPLIANSDMHDIPMFGKDFTLIDAPSKPEEIINAIKKQKNKPTKKVAAQTRPYTAGEFLKITSFFVPKGLRYFAKRTFLGRES
jgi:predicted metal-dependent phosphoesterase TrpH